MYSSRKGSVVENHGNVPIQKSWDCSREMDWIPNLSEVQREWTCGPLSHDLH